jgi:hypothetical protein
MWRHGAILVLDNDRSIAELITAHWFGFACLCD